MNKYFYLPGYYMRSTILQYFLIYKDQHPDYFLSDRIIAGAYDLPEGLIWNGGRSNFQDNTVPVYNDKFVSSLINKYRQIPNFRLLHTCTNLLIDKKEYLEDKLCNEFIQKYYQPQDKIIIVNPILKKYLKDTYPQITFVNSTCLGITDLNQVNKLSENEIYVLNYNKNDDDIYLNQLQYKDNIEILCGELCVKNCQYRSQHYMDISKAQLNQLDYSTVDGKECPVFSQYQKKTLFIPSVIEQATYHVPNNRLNELSDMGFSHFKISGRSWQPFIWLQLPIYYLGKPQYQKIIYDDIFKVCQYLFTA